MQALRAFGVEEVSAAAELRRLARVAAEQGKTDWEYFWRVAREVSSDR